MLRLWFVSLSHSQLGQFMQTSKWGFAVVETIHLLALALLGGAVLLVDLRLMGVILQQEPLRRINRDLSRLLLGSLVVMILSGIAMVSEEAMKCYSSPAFRWKMALLGFAVLFYFTLHRRAVLSQETDQKLARRVTAIVSITLWLGVGIAGRAIGLI
jgi:hypothetical protein